MTKASLFDSGLKLLRQFCEKNDILNPKVIRIEKDDRRYFLGACGFYRNNSITIMVDKCANPGYGGRAWSWPGYAIDRTPYGVIQHELGHHVDHCLSKKGSLFSYSIFQKSKEDPLTGYLGTDSRKATFYMEWFAENFRLFQTNPDLCRLLRPRFHEALAASSITPVMQDDWLVALTKNEATQRIINQARIKIDKVSVNSLFL